MRLVAWNLRSGTDRKWAALRAMQADVAVISEAVQRPAALTRPTLGDDALTWEWEGTDPNKGIALAAWDQPLQRRVGREAGGRWVIAGAVGQLLIVGIWSCPMRGGAGNYSLEVERSLDAVTPLFERHHEVVVTGDFNLSPRSKAFQRVRARLHDFGLVSAYHHHTGDPFGFESAMTFHSRHGGERSQHIDYLWCSNSLAARITDVQVGDRGPSDHSPIVVDVQV